MGGKKYPKKSGSEGSGSTEKSTASSSGTTPSTVGPTGRANLLKLTEEMSISGGQEQRSKPQGKAQQQKPQQGGSQQQQRTQQSGPQQGGSQQQRQQQGGPQQQKPQQGGPQQSGSQQQQRPQQGGPQQQQRSQQGGPQQSGSQQQQRPQQGGPQQQQRSQQSGSQQQQRPQQGGSQQGGQRQPQQAWGQSSQQGGPQQQQRSQQGGPQQSGSQQQQRPQQGGPQQGGHRQPQQVWGQSSQQGGQGQRPQQQSWGQQSRPQGGARPKDDNRRQQPSGSGMTRTESMQSVRSEQSSSSGGARKQQENRPAPITMDDLKKKGINELKVKYKGPGKRGRSLGEIETNYLKIVLNNLVENAYHYDVKIEPDRPKKLLTAVFLRFTELNYPKECIAFDGQKNAYATKPLKIGDLEREIKIIHPETGRERTFTVAIQAANDSEIPIRRSLTSYQNTGQAQDPKRAMQAVEVVLKSAFHQAHLKSGVVGGRSFYLPPPNRIYLGDFYELWLGLFQSMVLGKTPFLNVDVNHKAFPKRYASLLDLLKDMDKNVNLNRELDYDAKMMLKRHLSGLELYYNKPNDKPMIFKFMEIVDPPAKNVFTTEDGQQKTILQYFQETNRRIQFPNLNCIRLGSHIKSIKVPIEFCSISDSQMSNKKCTENQTRNLIREAATSTDIRKQKIMQLLQQIQHNQCPTIKGFGINIDTNFTKVPARQLAAPALQYKNSVINPMKGVWRAENETFLISEGKVIEWSILNTNFRTRQNELQEFAGMLFRISRSTGLQLNPQPNDIRMLSDRDLPKIKQELDRIGNEKRVNIVFCVVPDNGPMYSEIKKYAEIVSKNGVLTQCIKGNTIFKKRSDGSTISNLLLKVNAKLNGTNYKLKETPILMDKKCLLIGADVTHPSPDQTRIPSVVGVAASYDSNAYRYRFYWRLQGQRIEIISDFKDIIKEHLKFYQQENDALPEKIFYYRDGVSEGQFDQVMAIESSAMKDACREIQPGYDKQVKMTVVVVQKRHHTRFFPGNTQVGRDDRKNNNVPCGTIVDTVITRPNENHFYLVSHQSIQGVAKPTKYCILLDEADHNIDDLQALTYNLCHLFTRCNRTVSYPAPTYYAHLAAYRGRVYIENEKLNMNNLQSEWSKRAINTNIISGRPMFFV
ncbi:protein argonaute-2 [Contarinia nasturtii]|uniref:protein argonaute-2 n=1 Tax=Contarinia nasturtii TaxID=265458 RepID=UPI0012D4A097|nr:protein argonaute-2 [Contarinia nasturtii]